MPSEASPVDFVASELEASVMLGEDELEPRPLQLGADCAALLGFPMVGGEPPRPLSLTMKFEGKLVAAGGILAGTLEEAEVTVARGPGFLHVHFEYFLTSHGFRTDPLGLPHGLHFKNQDGGTMYSWGFPSNNFILRCGWTRHHCEHVIRITDFVDWFDSWAGVLHRVSGPLFRC